MSSVPDRTPPPGREKCPLEPSDYGRTPPDPRESGSEPRDPIQTRAQGAQRRAYSREAATAPTGAPTAGRTSSRPMDLAVGGLHTQAGPGPFACACLSGAQQRLYVFEADFGGFGCDRLRGGLVGAVEDPA